MATDTLLLAHLLLLVVIANGAPVLAHTIWKQTGDRPLDGGIVLRDGRPLFGPSKTVRGVVASLIVTSLAAPIVGLAWYIGLLVALGAMLGDLLSSFTKRRLNFPPSSQALGIDQIPESLLPLWFVQPWVGITLIDVLLLVGAFIVLELALSRVLYRLRLRERPY